MRAYNVFKLIVFTLTTAVLFNFWSVMYKIIESDSVYGVTLTALVTVGTYRTILNIAEKILENVEFIKKIVFGNSYLEGVWVGFYINNENKPVYYIEHYEQDFDGLIIRGKCFDSNKKFKGKWVSENVDIDERKGILHYTYLTEMINNSSKKQGLAEFNFERKDRNKAPLKLYGFSSDIFNQKKLMSVEEKVLDNTADESKLLELAVNVYEANKYIVP